MLKTIQKWSLLKVKHELRSLLGAGFVDTAKLMTQFTEKRRTCQWFADAEAAFWSLEEWMCTAHVLEHDR
jgi:hypothetical protein